MRDLLCSKVRPSNRRRCVSDDVKVESIEDLLDRLEKCEEGMDRVTIGAILDAVGRRAFGPVLLVLGLIIVSPLSGVPGLPTSIAVMTLLIAVQLLFGRNNFWLPRWLVRRSMPRPRLEKAVGLVRSPARFIDRCVRRRWSALTQSTGLYVTAAVCVVISLLMPPLELLPFASSIAGAALAAFGLGLIVKDGVLVLVALAFSVASLGFVGWKIF
jgi:hypothetical protein